MTRVGGNLLVRFKNQERFFSNAHGWFGQGGEIFSHLTLTLALTQVTPPFHHTLEPQSSTPQQNTVCQKLKKKNLVC